MVEVKQHAWLLAGVAFVHQYRTTAHEISMALQCEVNGGIQQRVARADEGREGLTLWGDECLFKRNTLVPGEDWFADAN